VQNEALAPLLEQLESGFDRNTRPFSNTKYMEVYRVCYLMCTQRSPHNYSETLYGRHGELFKEYLTSKVLPSLDQPSGVPLLKELRSRWANHNIMNKWTWKFFRYLVSSRPNELSRARGLPTWVSSASN
jgi:cullin 1